MNIQTACYVPRVRLLATGTLSRPKCPGCGSIVLMAEESRFNAGGHIEHFWSCDDCRHEFVTAIDLAPGLAPR